MDRLPDLWRAPKAVSFRPRGSRREKAWKREIRRFEKRMVGPEGDAILAGFFASLEASDAFHDWLVSPLPDETPLDGSSAVGVPSP